MPYNRTGKITSIDDNNISSEVDFDYGQDTRKFSDLDLANGVIFVPIDSNFDVTFTSNLYTESVTFSTDNNLIRGTVQLTHICSSSSNEDNNILTLKNEAKPSKITQIESISSYIEDIVMLDENSSSVNEKISIIPKINLSSNTVYFLNLADDGILDSTEKQISFEVGSGFMTDNSRSLIISSQGIYSGFNVNTIDSENLTLYFLKLSQTQEKTITILVDRLDENGERIVINGRTEQIPQQVSQEEYLNIDLESFRTDFIVGDNFYLLRENDTIDNYNLNKPLFGKITNVDKNNLKFTLDLSCYRMNVAYSSDGTNTEITTYNKHNLNDEDLIKIYDVVSGDVKTDTYRVTRKDDFKFTIPYNISSKNAGRLNYHPILSKNQDIVNVKTIDGQKKVTLKKATTFQNHIRFRDDINLNSSMKTLLYANPNGGASISPDNDVMLGRIIKKDEDVINYVCVNSDNQIITDNFVNNSILEISNGQEKLLCHIKANTYPNHNVHPFNTSAPEITQIYPSEGQSTTSKIKISEISRNDSTASVTTNLKHTLSIGDKIYIDGKIDTIFTGPFLVSEILDEYSFRYLITKTINENSPVLSTQRTELLYFLTGIEETSENLNDVDNYQEKVGIIQINFSQSMNTSTITVSNSSHLICSNGVIIPFSENLTKLSSTIQLSKSNDNFDLLSLVDFDSVTSNTGNSQFILTPSTIEKYTNYYLKVKSDVSDLGGTTMTYNFQTTEPITTGFRPVESDTTTNEPSEIPIYELDTTPPTVKKIYFSDSNSSSVLYQKILDSRTISQISDPTTYEDVELDLNGESILIMFDESIDPTTITVNTESTRPSGTIQLSCDDFNTVVQMESPVVLKTIEESDTFSFKPLTKLSSNSNYKLKITKKVGDKALNKNYLEEQKISDIKSLVLQTIPDDVENYYVSGETIRGTKRLFVRSALNLINQNFQIDGLTSGKVFYGFTTGGRGKVYQYGLDEQGDLSYIDYTPIESGKYIIDIAPGEICGFEENEQTYRFSVDYTAIGKAPEGTVIEFIENESRLIYREKYTDVTFARANDRIYGYTSKGIGKTSDPSEPTLPGFNTKTEPNLVKFYATNISDQLVTNFSSNQENISPTTDIHFAFDQTMNVDSLSFNTNKNNQNIQSTDNLILSYDSNFSNCIPFSPYITSSNNDTFFKLSLLMKNDDLQLSQNSFIYFGTRGTAKTKGGTLPYTTNSSQTSETEILIHNYTFKVSTTDDFKILKLIIDNVNLLEYDSNQDNSITDISLIPLIQIIFNETVSLSSFTIGQNNSFELSTDPNFQSNFITGTVTIYDIHKNRIVFIPDSELTTLTDYYLRINNNDTVENPYGVILDKSYTYAKFTTK